MNSWKVIRTDTFLQEFKKYGKNGEIVNALDKKIKRLKENPESVGGFLSGRLHGYKSTRIIGRLRLIFKINGGDGIVYLSAIDHRKFGYKRFN
jgi:mRNA-degrading endonuclease RelE of RelBE toxin-antitoxin system